MPAGRKPAHYVAKDGTQVRGLSRRPTDGRWRVIGSNVTFTCDDEALAIHRYLTQYAPARASAVVDFPVPAVKPHSRVEDMPVLTTFDPVSRRATQHISEAAAWAWVREQILARPHYVAQMTGIEQIGYLADLPKPTASPTLVDVGELYLGHARISANWRSKCRLFWQEFRDCAGVPKLRDLTQEHLVAYGDMVREAAPSPTYARQRFGAVKAIVNYPTKRGKWAEDCKRALALCAVLVPPGKAAADPDPITPEAFQSLYRNADARMKAVLLLALNCCMYAAEVAALDWRDFDLDKATLVTARAKTQIVRIATLWPSTVAALRALPRRTEALFLTEAGTRADYLSVYRLFRGVRKLADLEHVQFAQIRDGAYTAAAESGVPLDVCRLLAGHSSGISDHYVKRRPQMVASACAAIEEAYFGQAN
jgi:integrase